MGAGRWSPDDWVDYSTSKSYATKSTAAIFTSSGLDKELDPKGVNVRESRDSKDNPNSNPLIIGLDVTGSMGRLADAMARKGLNTLVSEIYSRKPVTDPHIMCAGIGDVECDRAPLQVTQFEADLRIAKQLEKIYLEGGGGGNCHESYAFLWYFAATHTAIDSFEKRGKKGYLFTIGDEEPTPSLSASAVEEFLGHKIQSDLSMAEILTLASRQWEIYHVVVEEGDYASSHRDRVFKKWRDVLGQRVIPLPDHTKLAEVIVSAVQIAEGENPDKVVGSWDGSTALVVGKATKGLTKKTASGGGIVTL